MSSAIPRVHGRLRPLLLERFYAKWEFAVQHNLSASDPEPVRMTELLGLADQETRTLWENLTLGYTQPDGGQQLRSEVASQYHHVETSHVTLTTGAQEALYLLTQALVAPGDHAVVLTPAYQLLYEGVRAAGGQVSRVPRLYALLELPFEHVIVSHGQPVHAREAFVRALDREPWVG